MVMKIIPQQKLLESIRALVDGKRKVILRPKSILNFNISAHYVLTQSNLSNAN